MESVFVNKGNLSGTRGHKRWERLVAEETAITFLCMRKTCLFRKKRTFLCQTGGAHEGIGEKNYLGTEYDFIYGRLFIAVGQ